VYAPASPGATAYRALAAEFRLAAGRQVLEEAASAGALVA